MAIFRCKMCGGNLDIIEGSSICVCKYCTTKQTVPLFDNNKKETLFLRANRLRFNCEFDKAYSVYEAIVAEFPEEAEAYWGLVLCKYGVEYVDDPKTAKKIPTCHRSSFDSVMNDENFEKACEYSVVDARELYRSEAKQIEQLRRGIIEISSSQDPYDIFICYKETDRNGERTIDSVIAQDVYEALTKRGYRVFFARISLEDKLGKEYEPYIFSALHSAKIMLVFGTDYEHFDAVWVKNEWSRFLKLMEDDSEKTLIPCFKDIDAYDMPKEFAHLQAQDMGKVGAMQDLLRGIEKILDVDKKVEIKAEVNDLNVVILPLLSRARIYLKNSDYEKADEYFDKVLDFDQTNEESLIGKLLAESHVGSVEELANGTTLFEYSQEYDRLIKVCSEDLKKALVNASKKVRENLVFGINKALNQKQFSIADSLCNKILKCDDKNETALISKIFLHYGVSNLEELERNNEDFGKSPHYNKLLKHCSDETKTAFNSCLANIRENIEKARKKAKKQALIASLVVIALIAIGLIALIPKYIWGLEKYDDGWAITDLNKKSLIENGHLEIPTEIYDKPVVKIGNYAFESCELSSVTIPNSVKTIGDGAFHGCSSLTNITLPFVGNGSDKTYFGYIFGASSFTENSSFVPSSLKNVTITGGTSIGSYAFYNCSSLTSVEIPSSVTSIGNYAFDGCSSLTSIEIPSSVTSIGQYAFSGCSNLTSIVIPNSVTSIDNCAFSGCSSLTSIVIPSSVTSIGNNAFSVCSSLTSIEIPSSVTSIGNNVFYGCTRLTIYCEATSKPSGWSSVWNPYGRPVRWGYNKDAIN